MPRWPARQSGLGVHTSRASWILDSTVRHCRHSVACRQNKNDVYSRQSRSPGGAGHSTVAGCKTTTTSITLGPEQIIHIVSDSDRPSLTISNLNFSSANCRRMVLPYRISPNLTCLLRVYHLLLPRVFPSPVTTDAELPPGSETLYVLPI